jgi:acetaldehyde dehydrogenase / alcohol dehydrogenase
VASKSFDNSILCTNESTVMAFTAIADRLFDAMKAEKAHVCSAEETDKLQEASFHRKGFNGDDRQGRRVIAREAGFNATGAKILVAPVDLVQPEEKLVREKLCPVLAFARVGPSTRRFPAARSMMRKPVGAFRCDPFEATRPTSWPFASACLPCALR